jgi:drug/metabolite transporter (DMT)-like permease
MAADDRPAMSIGPLPSPTGPAFAMKPSELFAYLFLAVTWGFSFLILLKVVHAFGWVGAVAFRAFIASGVLLVVALATGRRLSFAAGWRPFAVVGATTVAGQLIGLSFATPKIGTAMAAICVASIPLFSMVIGRVWGNERMSGRSVAGLVLGFAGIVLLVGFPAVPVTPGFVLGCAAALASAFCAAFGSNYANRHLRYTGALEVTIGSFFAGGLIALPLLPAVPVPGVPGPVDYGYLLLLGGVMSAVTYVTYFWLLGRIGATRTISVEFVVTVFAVLIGAGLLGETLTLVQVVGAAVIIAGCALVLGIVPNRPLRETAR